ncbi:MAG: hypothetical protein IJ347_06670 [Faecalibacterium sp.]|nr:hypothetical protein [Faecalibacterium sp.]
MNTFDPNLDKTLPQTDKSGLSDEYKAHCVPCRQKDAEDFLAGGRPGWRAFYAPGSPEETMLQSCSPTVYRPNVNTAVQDDVSVEEAVRWQVESADG